jgi:hypothetical protein
MPAATPEQVAAAEAQHLRDKAKEAQELIDVHPQVAATLNFTVTCTTLTDDHAPIPAGSKKVHFIRHGEG